jgi:hypothetical protein
MHTTYRIFLTSLCLFLIIQHTKAQGDPAVELIPKVEVGLMGLGVGLEYPVTQKGLIDLGVGMGGGYYKTEDEFRFSLNRSPVIYVNAGYRHMYNRQGMVLRGENTLHNAGSFVGGKLKYASQSLSDPPVDELNGDISPRLNNTVLAEAHWGMQIPLTRRFFFNFHVGAGYAWDINFGAGSIYPAVNVSAAYNLFSEKRRN